MGKGNRVRTQNADERKAKKEAAVKKAAKDKLYHKITVAVSVILVAALAFTFIWAAFLGDLIGRMSLKNTVAMKTENYSVSAAEFTYLYANSYLQYQSAYAGYLSYLGLDTTKPLKDQAYTGSAVPGYTWHDHFVDQAKTATRELLVLCEAAKDRNIALDDEDKKLIEDSIAELKATADAQNISFKKFMKSYFGEYITEDDVRKCMEMQTLAGKVAEDIRNEPKYDDAALEKEVSDKKGTYYFSDYLSLEIKANYTTGAKDDVIKAAKEEAKAKAEAILAKATDEEAFKKAIEEYYREVYNVVPDETKDENKTEDKAETKTTEEKTEDKTEDKREKLTESALKEKMDKVLTKKSAYTVETDLGKWLYEQDKDGAYLRKAGDAKLIEDATNGKYTVYMVKAPMYRNDYKLRDVRHLLITVDSYDKTNGLPDADAKAKAEALLEEWKKGDATADTFAELAKKESKDTGSATNGGLYEDVAKGDMVAEFEDWLFAAKDKGETGIVKTSYGYHIMYYVGEGEDVKWKMDAENNLRDADYTKAYEALTEKFTVTVDDKAFKKVKQAGL